MRKLDNIFNRHTRACPFMYPFVQWTLEDVGQRVHFSISHKNVPVCWVCCLAGGRGRGGGFWAVSVTLQSTHSHSFTHSVVAPGLPWQKQNTTESWTLQGKAVHDVHRKVSGVWCLNAWCRFHRTHRIRLRRPGWAGRCHTAAGAASIALLSSPPRPPPPCPGSPLIHSAWAHTQCLQFCQK